MNFNSPALDKLARTGDLAKAPTRQSGNLSDSAASVLQTVRQIVLELPADASARQMSDAMRIALASYDDGINTAPAEAAARFAAEIDAILRDKAASKAIGWRIAAKTNGVHEPGFALMVIWVRL